MKKNWVKAGIVTVSDRRVQERLLQINQEYTKISKNKSKTTPAAESERKAYSESIAKTFDIKDPNARQAILDDAQRTDEAKEEDLAFFDDYLGMYFLVSNK